MLKALEYITRGVDERESLEVEESVTRESYISITRRSYLFIEKTRCEGIKLKDKIRFKEFDSECSFRNYLRFV